MDDRLIDIGWLAGWLYALDWVGSLVGLLASVLILCVRCRSSLLLPIWHLGAAAGGWPLVRERAGICRGGGGASRAVRQLLLLLQQHDYYYNDDNDDCQQQQQQQREGSGVRQLGRGGCVGQGDTGGACQR